MDFCVVKGSQESRLCYYCRTICFVSAHGCAGKMRLSFVYFDFFWFCFYHKRKIGRWKYPQKYGSHKHTRTVTRTDTYGV